MGEKKTVFSKKITPSAADKTELLLLDRSLEYFLKI